MPEPDGEALLAGRYRPTATLDPIAGAARTLASDTTTDTSVVVTTFARDGAAADAFASTAARYEAVHHPSLAAILAWSDPATDPTMPPLIVAAHVEGRGLADEPAPTRSAALGAVADVADAIAALHAAGLGHGALTLDAVVVAETGAATVSGAGAVTLRDAALGGLPVDPDTAADLRAIGALLYRVLTGQEPSGETTLAPALLDPTIGASLNGLTLALLATDPSRPPPPAAAVGLRLRALATDDDPVTATAGAHPTSALDVFRGLAPQGDPGLVAAAAAIAMVGLGVAFAVAHGDGGAAARTTVRTLTVVTTRSGIPTPPVTLYLTQTITEPGAGTTLTLGGGTTAAFPGTTVYTFRLIPTTIAQAGATTLNIPLTVTIPPR